LSRIVRSAAAERDAVEIWRYIAGDDADAANRLLDRIDEKLRFLAESPLAGTPRSEIGRDVRSFAVGNYLIFYRPLSDGIRVLRLLNAARDVRRRL
jgi:toxin ParE1/3/4